MLTDRHKIIQKWKPILDNIFSDIIYLLPYIENEVSYQMELKQNIENTERYVNAYTTAIEYRHLGIGDSNEVIKLPLFLKKIHIYLTENIPATYMEDIKTCVNPMTGEILYKYNGKFLSIKALQKQRIEDFLIDIDFNNVIDKLYDNDPKKYIRKIKLKRLNGESNGYGL
jgi:hypothetical protein